MIPQELWRPQIVKHDPEILKGQATLELRRSIVSAMSAGMTADEIVAVLESAIGVLKSGDMR